jgi:hypothetical protein
MFRSRGPDAFSADASGLRFWGGTQARRIDLAIPWTDVQELRLRSILGGTLLEVLVTPAATVQYRSSWRQFGDLVRMFFVPVVGARARVAAVVLPRPDPPRYQVPLVGVRPAELRGALVSLAPGTPIDMAS